MARTIASRRQKASAGRFVGRFAEQQLFRATLRQLAALRDRHDEQLTDDELSYAQIFLIAAEGGMGKTTLTRRSRRCGARWSARMYPSIGRARTRISSSFATTRATERWWGWMVGKRNEQCRDRNR